MSPDFIDRCLTFLQNTKISVNFIISIFSVSLFCAGVFLFFHALVSLLSMDHLETDPEKKTRLQTGIELFIFNYMQPLCNGKLDSNSKEFHNHMKNCEKIRSCLATENIKGQDFKIRPILFNMRKKYWGAAVHVILEKMMNEAIPQTQGAFNVEKVRKMHNAMNLLYECNCNEGRPLEVNYKSDFWKQLFDKIIIGLTLAETYQLGMIILAGGYKIALLLILLETFFICVFRRRLRKIQMNPNDVFLSIPFMLFFIAIGMLLQHFGVVPVLV